MRTHTIERHHLDIIREPLQHYEQRYLTCNGFAYRRGVWYRKTLIRTESFTSIWNLPNPGEPVREPEPVALSCGAS